MMKMLDFDNLSSLGPNNFRSNPISDHIDFVENNHSGYEATYECRNSLLKTYPWISDFRKLCLNEMTNINMRSLMKLIKFYIKNVKNAVDDCYQRPKRAAKLKIEMSNTLMFFYYAYKEIKTPLEHFSYLEKMSELMAMYMDMEIKASRNGIESIRKVASMITSSLKIYFGNFQECILDSILKTNIVTKRHRVLGDLILRWILRDCPESPMDYITYIRCILVFKMWKEIMQGSKDEQLKILKLACIRLQPPNGLKEKLESDQSLRDFFPILPNTSITKFLMKAKFSSREKAKIFYKVLSNSRLKAYLNYTSNPINESSDIIEKGITPFDRLLNDMWINMNGSFNFNCLLLPSAQVIQRPKYKRQVEVIESDVEDIDIKSEIQKKPPNNSSINTMETHSIKLEIEGDLIDATNDHSCHYEHSIEDLSYSVEENKVEMCWKSDLDVKREGQNIMKEEKSEYLDSSEYPIQKSDLDDEIIGSSNECIFDLIEDLNVDGGKVYDGEHSSSLPFKKRRGLSFNKDKSDTETSEINYRSLSRNYLINQSLESKTTLNSSANSSNCEECNASECMNVEECNAYTTSATLPYATIVNDEHEERKITFKTPAQLKAEEKKTIFKTPAQLKAFHNLFYESPCLINLALGSHSDYFSSSEKSFGVSRETDNVSDEKPTVVKKKATTTSGRGRKKRGRGRPRKRKLSKKEDSNRLLDELTTTAGLPNQWLLTNHRTPTLTGLLCLIVSSSADDLSEN